MEQFFIVRVHEVKNGRHDIGGRRTKTLTVPNSSQTNSLTIERSQYIKNESSTSHSIWVKLAKNGQYFIHEDTFEIKNEERPCFEFEKIVLAVFRSLLLANVNKVS